MRLGSGHGAWRYRFPQGDGSVLVLYAAPTIYHAIPGSGEVRAKVICRRVDHAAIYLLIAGTYTPVALVTLRGPWGWSLLGVIWGLAVVGVVLKSVFGAARLGAFSTAVYLAMGWLAHRMTKRPVPMPNGAALRARPTAKSDAA